MDDVWTAAADAIRQCVCELSPRLTLRAPDPGGRRCRATTTPVTVDAAGRPVGGRGITAMDSRALPWVDPGRPLFDELAGTDRVGCRSRALGGGARGVLLRHEPAVNGSPPAGCCSGKDWPLRPQVDRRGRHRPHRGLRLVLRRPDLASTGDRGAGVVGGSAGAGPSLPRFAAAPRLSAARSLPEAARAQPGSPPAQMLTRVVRRPRCRFLRRPRSATASCTPASFPDGRHLQHQPGHLRRRPHRHPLAGQGIPDAGPLAQHVHLARAGHHLDWLLATVTGPIPHDRIDAENPCCVG